MQKYLVIKFSKEKLEDIFNNSFLSFRLDGLILDRAGHVALSAASAATSRCFFYCRSYNLARCRVDNWG